MEQEEKLNKPVVGEFKGNPILTLNPDERYPFSFGLSKARLILAHLDDIRAFVEQYSKGKG
ncbi:MAG TPA: hypothetical protein PKJ13_03375 [bacterium]|nr:hypothetical protein [bacterium]HOC24324.1 hypothetical protein [bacterium]HOH07235.1 hypothetical protein [bacterium]HOY43313.1 hypothetical protein [bacterium]HPM59117.1 hypothetical protein [bacterium]